MTSISDALRKFLRGFLLQIVILSLSKDDVLADLAPF